jgi:hypothetical protein
MITNRPGGADPDAARFVLVLPPVKSKQATNCDALLLNQSRACWADPRRRVFVYVRWQQAAEK